MLVPIALGGITTGSSGHIRIGDMEINLTGAEELIARLSWAVEQSRRGDNPGPWMDLSRLLDRDYERHLVVDYRDMDTRAVAKGRLCLVQHDHRIEPRIRISEFLTANLRKRKDRWVGNVVRWSPSLKLHGTVLTAWSFDAIPTGMRISISDNEIPFAPLTDGCGRIVTSPVMMEKKEKRK